MKFVGHKYERNRDVREIAKLVRADIREASKTGKLPAGLKASVRISRYSGGQSISVYVSAVPGVLILNPERVRWDAENPHGYYGDAPALYTRKGREILDYVSAVLSAYNFDDSESQVDYFHVNFYTHVSYDGDLESAQRDFIRRQPDQAAAEEPDPEPAPEQAPSRPLQPSKIPAVPVFYLRNIPSC